MATKDIDDLQVLRAFDDAQTARLHPLAERRSMVWPDQLLAERTGECDKVIEAAMERAYSRGYLECGVTVRSGWLTKKGAQYLDDNKGWIKGGPRFVRDASGALILIGSEKPNAELTGSQHDG